MANKKLQIRNSTAEFLIFTSQAGENSIEVMVQDETVWLTQKMIAALFGSTKQNVGQHLKKIFEERELLENSVVKNFFTTAEDGKQYNTAFYNLDAIISVGYRVKGTKHDLIKYRLSRAWDTLEDAKILADRDRSTKPVRINDF